MSFSQFKDNTVVQTTRRPTFLFYRPFLQCHPKQVKRAYGICSHTIDCQSKSQHYFKYKPSMIKKAYTYILINKNKTTLYVGVTNELERRIVEHKTKKNSGFTAKYNLDLLVYYETHHNIGEAIYREKQLKKKSKLGKIRLICKRNPEWNDLSNVNL